MSWLSFNERVLFEAFNLKNPLLERLRFIDIFRSNNDEFFMKRVSLLISKIESGDGKLSIDGRNSLDLYNQFLGHVRGNWDLAQEKFASQIIPELEDEGIKLYDWKQLSTNDKAYLVSYFRDNIFPILTPLAVDAGHPFPFLSNLSKSIGVCIRLPKKKEKFFARVKIPTELPQWIPLKSKSNALHRFINIEEVLIHNLQDLFPGMKIESSLIFRITRDASMGEDDEEVENLMEWVTEGLKERKFSQVVRLEVDNTEASWLINFLMEELALHEEQIFQMPSLICYSDFSNIIDINDEKLRYVPFKGETYYPFDQNTTQQSIFESIAKKDHLIHFPYESYKSSVEKFLKAASNDPKVRAIKIVLYRTDDDGRLIDILINAAENGKQVAVVIELTARFDEERNIKWAQRLEDFGIHVSYGLKDLKTHAKMILVIRDENKKLKTYVNIGTGNFNGQTSKFYTDLSYFTAKKAIGEDVVQVFNYLTGRSLVSSFKRLLVAPFNMHMKFTNLINNEVRMKKMGYEAEIIAKMNSLEDPDIIESLYRASQAGVKITLLVRGFCCIKPGVKGLSENIKVFSLVGRLLEHSRCYYFRNGSKDHLAGKFYLGSSDWMKRNLHHRVEIITPIMDQDLKQKLWMIMNTTMKDNQNVWELMPNGTYKKRSATKGKFSAQNWFIEHKKDNI
jgi:polyphosphate kinase